MNEWYKKWFAAIWATIISCIFIAILFLVTNTCSAKYIDSTLRKSDLTERAELMNAQTSMGKIYRERLDDLFSKWDSILEEDRNELRNTLKTISICLSIWIGIIAAICTILPIVLGINANSIFQKDIARAEDSMIKKMSGGIKNLKNKLKNSISAKEALFNKKVEETERQFQTKVEAAETKIRDTAKKQEQMLQELRTTLDESLEMSKSSQIAQTLYDLSVHMRVISELQEFESHDKATLTKAPLLQRVLENLLAELGRIKEDIQQDNCKETTFVSILLIWCMLKRLLTAVESSFKDYNLLTLQKLKSKIDNEVTNNMKVPKGEAKNKELLSLSYDYAVEIENLFEEYIKENRLEQKEERNL